MKLMDHIEWANYFYYDESSKSCLRRAKDWTTGRGQSLLREPAGTEVGAITAHGHYVVKVEGKSYLTHRIVMCLHGEKVDGKHIDHRDQNPANNSYANLRIATLAVNSRNRKLPSTSTSGVVGVGLNRDVRPHATYIRWRAEWRDLQGKKCCKFFSINKLGNDEAFKQACEWRVAMIEQLNQQGAGYTDDHGTK